MEDQNKEYLNKKETLEYTGWSKSTLARYLMRYLKEYHLNCFDIPQVIEEKTKAIKKIITGKTKHNKDIFVWDYLKDDLPKREIKKKEDTPRATSEDTPRATPKIDEGGSKLLIKEVKKRFGKEKGIWIAKERGFENQLKGLEIKNATLETSNKHLSQNIQNREEAILRKEVEMKEKEQKLHSSLIQLGIEKGRADGLETQIKLIATPKKKWWQK